jgi:hypothetical protein
MRSSHTPRGQIPTPALPGTRSSDRRRRGIRGRQRVRRPSPCLERGTRMELWVAPRGVPTPIASLPAPQGACRSPINALRQTGFAPAHAEPSFSESASKTKALTRWFRPGQYSHVGRLNLMSTPPRPNPGRPDEIPRPGPAGPRTPYPVNDPGFADPNKPGSEPDFIPPPSPAGTPEI